jgi:hypothetical protein
MFLACGLMAFAQTELSWTDFPYTASDGNVITQSTSGSATQWTSGTYGTCGVTLKSNSTWLGLSGPGTITNTFSSAVTTVSYKVAGSDPGEAVTVTTNAGTPVVTVSGGCGYIASGNVATCNASPGGTTIIVTSANPFTSITVSHNGAAAMNGSLFTMIYSGVATAIPVSPWAIAILFLVIGTAGYFILRKTAAMNGSPA